MENLKKLHRVLVRDGYTQKSFDDFVNEAATDAVYQKKIYEVVYRDQLFGGTEEEFAEKYFKELPTSPLADVKKKDDSDFTSEEEVMVSNTQEVQTPGLSGPSAPQTETVTQEEVVDERVEQTPPPETQPEIQQIQEVPNRTGASYQEVQNYEDAIKTDRDFTGEESTDIEDFFGKNWFTDFIGDMYRAGAQGQAQGGTLDESLELFAKGQNVTDEDIQDFIIAQQEMQRVGQSDEMREFNSIYQKEGGSWWGFIKGVAANPTVIPQLFVSSVSAMVNPTVIAAAAAGGGAGAAAGSTGFSMGPLGVATTAGGAIAGAMGAAGGTLETGLTFAELLLEELDGKPMTKANVREILEDPEAMQSIRWKSAGRGFAIGMVDAISAGVAGKITSKVAGLTGKKMLAAGTGIGVEAVGGSAGEVAGRLVAGQEMDVAEIGFEGVAGTATAPLTVGYGLYKAPKYYINKQSGGPGVAEVSGPEMAKFIREASPEDIAGATLEIVNDPELKAIAEEKKKQIMQDAGIIKQLKEAGITDDATIIKLVELEKQRDALSGNKTRAGKKKLAEIDALIDQLMDGVDVDITTLTDDQGSIEVTDAEARESLEADNELNAELESRGMPNAGQQIIDNAAIQERKAKLRQEKQEANITEETTTETQVTPDSERLTALEETLNEKQKETVALMREKGKSEEMITTYIRNKAKENGKGNTLTQQYKAEDIIANPEQHSEALVVNAYRYLKGTGGSIDGGNAVTTTENILIEVKEDIANGVSIESASYLTGQKKGIRQAYEMMLESQNNNQKTKQDAIQESSTETVDVQEFTEDSQEVGEGDTPGQPTQESQEGDTDTETQTQAEVVEDIDGEPTITDQETREATADLGDLIQRIDDNNPGQNKSRSDVDEIEDTEIETTPEAEVTTPEAEVTTVEAVTTDTDGNLNIIESQGGTQVNLPGQQVNNTLSVTERTTEENDNHYSSDRFTQENPNTTVEQHETKILDLANKAATAISKILPDTKIIIHRSEDAYNQFVTRKGMRGTFDPNTNTIHINMPKANAKTIAHEVFHAMLYNKYGTEIKIAEATKRMVDAVKRKVTDKKLKQKLDDFSKQYTEFQNEEYLSELVGILADNYPSLSAPEKSLIKRWLQKIAKMLKIEALIDTDADIVDLLNTIGKSVKKGKEITATDVKPLETVGKTVERKSPAKKQKQRQQKAPIDRLAKRYDMKANGVIFAKPGIDRFALENWAKGLGYTVKITRGDRGQITSYQLMKDGRRYRPGDEKRKQRQQIVFTKSETPASIIRKARELGFNNPEIRDVLRENTDLKVSQINAMLEVPVDAFKNLPDSFINVKGGIKQGLSAFKKINEFISQLNKKNQTLENPLTQEQLATKAIEKLQSTEVYKNAADFIKVKGERVAKKTPSTQQLAMEVAIRESFDVKPTKDAAKTLRNLKSKITERLRGMRDIQKVKRELRNFIRESLPNDQYTKSNVLKMVRFIANLTTKELTGPQLKTTMLKIQNFVTERNIANLKAKKDLLLDVSKYEKKENNLLKGKKVSADVKNRIKKIAESQPGPSMTAQEIEAQIAAWNEEANTISKKPLKTDGDLSRLSDLQIMINLSNSKLMDGSDIPSIHQVSVLDAANSALESLILEGRSNLREQLAAQRKEYIKEMQDLYNDMTGNNVDLTPKKFTVKDATAALKKDGITDPTDIQIADKIAELQDQNIQDIQKQMDQIQRDYDKNMNRLDAQKRDNILKKGFRYITEGITNFLNRAESLQGLMDIISLSPGKMLGGVAQKLVYKKINSSSIEFKGRMIMLQNKISDKMQEIYGKKWRKVARKNSEPVGTGVYRDVDAVVEAQKRYDENPTKENKKKLDQEIKDQEIVMSPNEIYYQYNQFIDPANKKSYLNDKNRNFKNDPDRIMQELYDTLTDETKEWARWQREEFFPELYNHYNEVYKKIYRTDMPWNEFYAGRIYRTDKDGMGVGEIDVLDLQGNRTQFNTSVGAASTKARIDNANPIAIMDGNDALMTYLTDMEWFAAYAENVRNISKLLGNENIKKTIEVKYGKDMNYLLKTAIDKIASRGINTAKGNKMVNVFNNIFITSRLGLNPTVMLKQLTSMPTYADSIGPLNYAKYAFKNKREMLKVYQEIRDNSVYMQDRNFGDMKKVIESYNQNQKVSFLPAGLKSKFDYFSDFMMVTTKIGDRAAIFLGGMPNYSYYKAEFKKAKPNATEQQAIDYAIRKFEADTKATQQSMDLQDKDYFQSGDPLARAFNMFMTTPKQYYRMERMAFRQLWRKTKAWDRKAGKGTLGQNLRTVAMYHAVMPALFQYVALGLPGMMRDRTDEDDQDMLRSIILGNLNALFIVGDMLTMGFDKLRGKPWAETAPSLPALEMMAELMRLADRVERTKDPEKKAEYSNKLTTKFLELSSLPASNLYKLYKNYEKLIDGDVDDPGEAFLRAFNFSDYVIEGQMNPPTKAEMDELKKKNPQAWKVAYPAWEKLYGTKKTKKSEYDEYKKNPQAWKRRNPGKKIPNRR